MKLKSYPRAYFELVISAFTLIMGMSLSRAFLPLFAYELDPSEVLVGFVSSAWFVSRVFTELPSGILADRFGRRKLMVTGLALSSVGALMCSLADSIYLLIAGRAVWGLGTGLFFMSSSAMIFDLFESRVRGRALGTFQSIEFAGSFIGAPIGSFMVASVGYSTVFLIASALIFCSFIVASLSKGLRQTDPRNEERPHVSFTDLLSILKKRGLAIVNINSFSRMLIMGLTGTVFPLYLNLQLGISVELIGVIVSVRTVGVILATTIAGYLSDRFGRKPVIMLGIALQSSCLYAYTTISAFEMFMLIGLFEGFSRGMNLTSVMVFMSEMVPLHLRGATIGMYRTFMDIGGFLGPIFFMMIFSRLGSSLTFISAVVILVVNMILLGTIRKSGKTEQRRNGLS